VADDENYIKHDVRICARIKFTDMWKQ